MRFRRLTAGFVLLGLVAVNAQPLLAQPNLGVPFTYDCVLWKEQFSPLPQRAQRDLVSAIGSVGFAALAAVLDLKKMLSLPFDPSIVVVGFMGIGLAFSLSDYWFTNEQIIQMKAEGTKLGCLEDPF